MTVTNPYYEFDPIFTPGTKARSDSVNIQYAAIQNAFDLMPGDADAITTGTVTFAPETGSVNAYEVTMPDTRTAEADGDEVVFFATHTNTGAATMEVDGLGPHNLVRADGLAVDANDIQNGLLYIVRYDASNTRYQLIGPSTSYLVDAAAAAAAALVSETNAALSELNAEQWAVHPEDDDLDNYPGEYSAFHWAQKALGAATSNRILTDITTATPPTTEAVSGVLEYYDADETDELASVGFSGSNTFRVSNEMRGGLVSLASRQAAGSLVNLFSGDPDGAAHLYNDGNAKLSTTVTGVLLPLDNTPATPTIAFGDGDTGFYENADDVIRVSIAGVDRWQFATNFNSSNVNGPKLLGSSPAATTPSLMPNKSDTDTGIGWTSADQLSLIAGGVEMMRLVETGLATTDQLIIGPAGIIGTAATPALAFGDGDTGFYESLDDRLILTIGGTSRWVMDGSLFGSNTGTGGSLQTGATATRPGFTIANDLNTGVGTNAADQLSLVAGGVEAMRLAEASSAVILSYQANVGLTADVGSAQGNGVILSTYNVYSTVGTTGDAATLPATFPVGTAIYVKNDGANSMDVFPASGDDAGAGTDTAVEVGAGESATFIATAVDATWSSLIAGGGSIPDGTADGQFLVWDETTDQAWEIPTTLLWDDANTKMTFGTTMSVETGGVAGSTGQTEFKNGIGDAIMSFYDTDGGGVAVQEPVLRLESQGGSAGSSALALYSSGGGRAFIKNSHTNYLTFGDETGMVGAVFEYPIAMDIQSAPTPIVGYTQFWTTGVTGTTPMVMEGIGFSYPIANIDNASYMFNNPTAASDPGGAACRQNTADFSTAAELYFNDEDFSEQDQGWWFGRMAVGDLLRAYCPAAPSRWCNYRIDSITDNTGWWTLEVTPEEYAGTNFVKWV